MRSYFIRHTKDMSVRDEDLEDLWNQNRIAIHYPDFLDGIGRVDNESTNPDDYPSSANTTVKTLKNLADKGGYVWAESRVDRRAKVGLVKPQEIELYRGKWTLNLDYPARKGTEAILKTVQLDKVKLVKTGEAVGLRAGRPRQGTICQWHKCGTRLADLVECRPVYRVWANLSTEQQEAACAEFLRHDDGDHPRLKYLLLPVGRTLKDVDIYGLDPDGQEIFAQVTYRKRPDRQTRDKKFQEKLETLKGYANIDTGVKLVYFCRCEKVDQEDGVCYIPLESNRGGVIEWINANLSYSEALFTTYSGIHNH